MTDSTFTQAELEQISDHGYGFRFAITLLLGVAVAGGLTLFMHVLIEASHKELDESARIAMLDFVRVAREESSVKKQIKPTKPSMNNAPPAPPTPQTSESASADTAIAVSMPTVNSVNVEIGAIGINASDGNYLPIVKVAPAYPAKAAMNGIEGECTVEYTVTTTGATKDIRIVEGLCDSVFARASVNAAKKFKYKPRVVGGEPIEVPQVRNRFEFKLHNREDVE